MLDSDEILKLDRPVESVVIVGAGPVGCEYASTFAAVGTRVWLVDRSERLLPLLDGEISELLASSLRRSGIEVIVGSGVARVERDDAG